MSPRIVLRAALLTSLVLGCGGDPPVNPQSASVRHYYEAKFAAHPGTDGEFAEDKDLGMLRKPNERAGLPQPVLEACDFYYQNVLEQDWGSVRAYQVASGQRPTWAIRVTSDGGDGWLEVFDEQGELLGSARTDLGIVLWRPRDEIRRRVTDGMPLEPEFLAERTRRAVP